MVAEFEFGLLLELTSACIARAKSSGNRCDRPPTLDEEQKKSVFLRIMREKVLAQSPANPAQHTRQFSE